MYTIIDCINDLRTNCYIIDASESNQVIEGVTFNSKKVKENYLFVCKGEHFKQEYLLEAIENGAIGYVSERKFAVVADDFPYIIVSDIRTAMTTLGLSFYSNPSKDLNISGFTATKGKTTVTHMMKSALDGWLGKEGGTCGLVSTIEIFDGIETVESFNTTPEAMELQEWLRKMVDNGVKYCSLEVSSQALRYGRTEGTDLKVATFMNIARDHISPREHKDFEDYFTAKLSIFDNAETGIVNLDMDHLPRVLEYAKEKVGTLITYSLKDETADFYCHSIEKEGKYTRFTVSSKLFSDDGNTRDEPFWISMPGWFNVSNAVAVIASCVVLGEPIDCIREGIKDARVDGRMEVFVSDDNEIVCVVDYAHNQLSYESLFKAVEEDYPLHSKNINIVFGSVGDKAFERREELGTITGKRAKMSYIAADYPGHEPFEKIASEIAHFVELQGGAYKIIEDRNVAIEEAIRTGDKPMVLLACGFGRLNWQKYGDEYIYRESDVECVERCLDAYNRGLL